VGEVTVTSNHLRQGSILHQSAGFCYTMNVLISIYATVGSHL